MSDKTSALARLHLKRNHPSNYQTVLVFLPFTLLLVMLSFRFYLLDATGLQSLADHTIWPIATILLILLSVGNFMKLMFKKSP